MSFGLARIDLGWGDQDGIAVKRLGQTFRVRLNVEDLGNSAGNDVLCAVVAWKRSGEESTLSRADADTRAA